jgi:amino acid transporter
VIGSLAFGGTELAGLAAAETVCLLEISSDKQSNPRQALPRACKQTFWRVLIFYIVSLTIIGCIVPYTHPQLGVIDNAADAKASPFVIAVNMAQIPIIPDILNAVILVSVLSVGNAATYGASRTLEAMAEIGHAPQFFTYVDKMGRPLATLALVLLTGPIAYIGAFDGGAIFGWLFALCGLSMFFTWYCSFQAVSDFRGSICLSHIRFRMAVIKQTHEGNLSLEDLPFQAVLGVYGSWAGLVLCLVCFLAAIYNACPDSGEPFSAVKFLQDLLQIPIVIVLYVGFKVWKKTKVVRLADADLVGGRREMNLHEEKMKDLAERAQWNSFKRVYRYFC